MIVKDDDAAARLNSPFNLINRMKSLSDNKKMRGSAMSLFIKPESSQPLAPSLAAPKSFNPFDKQVEALTISHSVVERSETIDEISKDHDSKIALGLAHDSAVKLLNNSISALAAKLDDVRADKLPAVIAAASKTVESIRRERLESIKQNKDREVHYHFYTPEQKKLSDYEVIEVS